MQDFEIKITRERAEVLAAQRLRFEVFHQEMKKGVGAAYEQGLDADEYDPFCEHLIVRSIDDGRVVGTYRLFLGSEARRHNGFYSEREFDLQNVKRLRGELLELGRSCVHRDFRDRTVIEVMWQAIADYIRSHEVRYLFGCASLHTTSPGEVGKFYALLKRNYYAPDELRVEPWPQMAFPVLHEAENEDKTDPQSLFFELPSLIKGYLRVGALLCGPPALDADFGTTDFFLLLDVKKMTRSYRRRFGFSRAKDHHAVA